MSDPEAHGADDADLIRRTAAGDHAAFDLLVRRHQAAVFRFARALAGQDGDAEDALQETFLAAWRGAAGWREQASVLTWLMSIARHAVYRQHRRRSGEPEDFAPLADLGLSAGWGSSEEPQRFLARLEDRDRLARALAALSAEDREVLVLRDVEGLSAHEAAQVLGLAEGAVRTRHHRARLRLLARLKEGSNHGR
ncbi:MAG TPA: sigma-70 family RNA polymerase sigma factor [Thermoanaerobaculia bacterium]|nr:sigma-70 family RNA polymerase sigma factor [Thermoanaerobaculia bacterium]